MYETGDREDQTDAQQEANGEDLIIKTLRFLRGSLPPNERTRRATNPKSEKESFIEWSRDLGLLLENTSLPSEVVKGGQEHDLRFDEDTNRYWKLTKNGVFGLVPGIDLTLVPSSMDGRNFTLWEADIVSYFERLYLHNLLVPELNVFEGVLLQPDEIIIVTSQPRFEIVAVTQEEIDHWFVLQGFEKVTSAAYYRRKDNLGVFDAHDKNVVRFNDLLIPFDVIPCHLSDGFLGFIEDVLKRGEYVRIIKNSTV